MRAGDVIGDRFDVERVIGSGGMGAVYRATDRMTGQAVAIKVLLGDGEAGAQRFAREARVLGELSHPGIVRYLAHGFGVDGARWLAMEWLEGEDLAARLARNGLSPGETLELARRVADALAAAHALGFVHRDIKPANLFLPGGDITRVKLLDFGVVRAANRSEVMTQTGVVVGTVGYMAPEQVRGDREISPAADVFSLGCVLFECVTGKPAFAGLHLLAVAMKILLEDVPRVSTLRPDTPFALDDLIARMLARAPAERFSDGRALSEFLATVVLEHPGGVAPVSVRPPALTASEQRMVSIVLAMAEPQDEATRLTLPTLTPEQLEAQVELVRDVVAAFGARVQPLPGGPMLVLIEDVELPTEQARRAARCGLAVRAALPGASVMVATRRCLFRGARPVGALIDVALQFAMHARVDGVCIDEVTAGLLDEGFEIERDDRGLTLCRERPPTIGSRTLLGRAVACVGRDREIAALEATFAECTQDAVARCVLVTAGPGAGKSRLLSEFLQRIAARPHAPEVLLGQGTPLSAGSPFSMLGPALRKLAGVTDGEDIAVQRDKFRARVARSLGAAATDTVCFLGELAQIRFPDETSVKLRAARADPMLMGDQMLTAWLQWLTAECPRRPMVIVLEDLHWGDVPSVKFIDAALRGLRDLPVMVLALARADVHQAFPNLWSGRDLTELRLPGLSRKAAEKLVRDALGDIDPATCALLVERADGNAFFLEELIRATAEGKAASLPETVLAMVEARLTALEPEARRVLRAASVFGRAFWRDGVATLLGETQTTVPAFDWLDELATRELVTKRSETSMLGQTEYVFRHALVREAAYAMLTDRDRMLGHKLAGEWLIERGDGDALTLAEHFDRGGERPRAAEFYARAAEVALDANDFTGSTALATLGLACNAPELATRLLWVDGLARRWAGDTAGAARCVELVYGTVTPGCARWFEASGELMYLFKAIGDVRVLDVFSRSRTQPSDAAESTAAKVLALSRAGLGLLFQNRIGDARELANELETVIATVYAPTPIARAQLHSFRGGLGYFSNDPLSSAEHYARSAEYFGMAGDRRNAIMDRASVGGRRVQLGDLAGAESILNDVITTATAMQLEGTIALARMHVSELLIERGALDDARTVMQGCVDWLAARSLSLEAAARNVLALAAVQAGDLDTAEREARRAIDMLFKVPGAQAQVKAGLARVLNARGRFDEALVLARSALAGSAGPDSSRIGENLACCELIRALVGVGAVDEARSLAGQTVARLRSYAERLPIADRAGYFDNVYIHAAILDQARELA